MFYEMKCIVNYYILLFVGIGHVSLYIFPYIFEISNFHSDIDSRKETCRWYVLFYYFWLCSSFLVPISRSQTSLLARESPFANFTRWTVTRDSSLLLADGNRARSSLLVEWCVFGRAVKMTLRKRNSVRYRDPAPCTAKPPAFVHHFVVGVNV